MYLPDSIKHTLKMLDEGGFKAYVVGGSVRDSLLGREISDYDICTDARPDDIKRVFSSCKTSDIGGRFGTISVLMGDLPIEITTFRSDGTYLDGRHPDSVAFSGSLSEDLARRDFTVNAIAFNPKEGYVDLFGGMDDIKQRTIRTVGDPKDRFSEDSLRILRALRFSATLKFRIEPKTAKAVIEYRKTVAFLSPERIRDELSKFIVAEDAGTELLKYKYNWLVVIPELRDCDWFHHRSPYHNLDVLGHIAKTVDNIEPTLSLRLTALLHDIAKPHTYVEPGRFPGHMELGAEMARRILSRLRYPNKLIDDIALMIRYHDFPVDDTELSAKKVLRLIGERLIFDFIKHKRADALAHHPDLVDERMRLIAQFEKNVYFVLESGCCYTLEQLAVDGNDLLALGLSGKDIGDTLELLLDAVIESRLENEKEALLTFAERHADEKAAEN